RSPGDREAAPRGARRRRRHCHRTCGGGRSARQIRGCTPVRLWTFQRGEHSGATPFERIRSLIHPGDARVAGPREPAPDWRVALKQRLAVVTVALVLWAIGIEG